MPLAKSPLIDELEKISDARGKETVRNWDLRAKIISKGTKIRDTARKFKKG